MLYDIIITASKQKHILNPAWNHLPPLRFEATYKEMITEWIDVNVQHHSKFDGFVSIGRCKLILKAILNDDALVSEQGNVFYCVFFFLFCYHVVFIIVSCFFKIKKKKTKH